MVGGIDAWTMKFDAARKTESWPKISISTFLFFISSHSGAAQELQMPDSHIH